MTEKDQQAHAAAREAARVAHKALAALPYEPGRTERWKAALDAAEAASVEARKTDKEYFRLNNQGMGLYATAMDHLGMLQHGEPRPAWPDADDIQEEEWDALYDLKESRIKALARNAQGGAVPEAEPGSEPVRKALSDYVDAVIGVLLWAPTPVTGINAFKFSSNDGWVVTPAEIHAALETYRGHTEDAVQEALGSVGATNLNHWMTWITFLDYAEQQGGFRVQ